MAKLVQPTSALLIPEYPTLSNLREAAAGCAACDLWKTGTQTVFGEGTSRARVMMVGEQSGDKEDLRGRPFVGPAGAVLDKALAAALSPVQVELEDQMNQAKGQKPTANGPLSISDSSMLPFLTLLPEPGFSPCLS